MIFKFSDEERRTIGSLDFKSPHTWIATWFGLGFFRPAPGTWGSLGALPFGILIYGAAGPGALLLAVIIMTIIGMRSVKIFQEKNGTNDSPMIVVDEVCGQWLALLAAGVNLKLTIAAFLFFRFFDILKPPPVSWSENQEGAFGVMADDLVAGLMAMICVVLVRYAGFG